MKENNPQMINQRIHKLRQAEKLSGIALSAEQEKLPYKRFDQTWIRADRHIREIYSTSLKYSELQFYPNTYYKVWGVWLLTQLKLKKGGHKLNNLLGIRLKWFFTKQVYLPLMAEVIYCRDHTSIMVYNSLKHKKVIKVASTKWGKSVIKSEADSQRLASSVASNDVVIPSIFKEFHDEHLNFTVEEYFQGKKQSFKDKSALQVNYHKVFQFIFHFYFSNPIELQCLSKSKFLNHGFVEDFIQNQKDGAEVVSIFKTLYAKKRKMILCRIHGDLSHKNILSDGDRLCIIDWGKSKLHYLARDLDNSSYDTQHIYEEFVAKAKIDKMEVYSYGEQLFLARYIEMNRLIHDGIIRKTITNELYHSTAQQNRILIKMAEKL